MPAYKTELSSGMDLRACVEKPVSIRHGRTALIPTGIRIELEDDYEAQIRPRSGLAAEWGVTILNSPGTIDADYRGEIKIILINLGKRTFRVSNGDRIAQMVVSKICRCVLLEVKNLKNSGRGEGGFGSTGIK